jgi:predicted permease
MMRWISRRNRERDLDKEVSFHIEELTDEFARQGLDRAEARRRAILELGSSAQIKEECRDVRPLRWLEIIAADVRYALRGLRHSPAFTLTAVVSIALGIGANAAIFTLLYAALWKPLPVAEPRQLYHFQRFGSLSGADNSFSYVLFQELQQTGQDFGQMFAKSGTGLRKFGVPGGELERAVHESVSGNYFDVLRIRPAAGRTLEPSDDSPQGGNNVAVLSYAFWERRFHGDTGVLGQIVLVDERPYTVVGIARQDFRGTDAEMSVDLWTPLTAGVPKEWLLTDGAMHSNWMRLMFRLNHGAEPRQAEAALLARFRAHVEQELSPSVNLHFRTILAAERVRLRPAGSGFATTGRKYEKPLLVLMGVVALVLLISCVNVANLVLARNLARRQELGVRLALGAGRARILSQLLTESLLVALAGAVIGVALAEWASRSLLAMLPPTRIALAYDLRPDATILAFTAAVTITAALLFGAGPALQACRASSNNVSVPSVRVTGRTLPGRLLVVAQIALSLVLAAGAGLFVTTLAKLAALDPGFRTERVWTSSLIFPRAATKERKTQTTRSLTAALSAEPETLVSYSFPSVYEQGGWSGEIGFDGQKRAPGEDTEVCMFLIGPQFFEALRAPMLSGRPFAEREQASRLPVAIVNETLAKRFLPRVDALGHHLDHANSDVPREIVGVVRDIHHQGVRVTVCPTVYLPGADGQLVIRSALGPRDLLSAARTALRSIDPSVTIESVDRLQSAVDGMISQERLVAFLSAGFGALAALLAAIGLYGVMAYNTSRRTVEIGIRLALGARPAVIRTMILREATLLIGGGVLAGLPIAWALARLIKGMLFGVAPGDPMVYLGAAAVLAAAGILAALLPARRAAHLEPTNALRHQ